MRPRNALLAAFLTQDDATRLEGFRDGHREVAYCGFAVANATPAIIQDPSRLSRCKKIGGQTDTQRGPR
jgi:hypothetical protein